MNGVRAFIVGALFCLAWLAAPVAADAAPSMTGSTGMIRIPAADALRWGHVSAGYYTWQEHGVAVVGVGLPEGLELSGTVPWNAGRSESGTVNLKWNLKPEGLLFPAVSLGVEDIGGVSRRSVYGVVSKALPLGFRLHVGTGTGRFAGMFGALEKVLNPTPMRQKQAGFPVTSLIVEMDGVKLNYGARLRLAQGLRLDLGWLGQEEKIFCGLTFTN